MDFERYQTNKEKKKTLKAIFSGFQLEKRAAIQGLTLTKISFEHLWCPLSINTKISIFKFGSP